MGRNADTLLWANGGCGVAANDDPFESLGGAASGFFEARNRDAHGKFDGVDFDRCIGTGTRLEYVPTRHYTITGHIKQTQQHRKQTHEP